MLRYLRLFSAFVRFSFSRSLEFRLDFTFRIVMDCFYYAVNIGFYKVLFIHFSRIGGWNEDQVLLFVAGYLVVDALHMTLFSNNLWLFPQTVNRGDLDYYLVRPVSSLFFMSFKDFAANSFFNLLISTGILVYAIANYSRPLTAGEIALYSLLLVNGTFLYYAIQLTFTIPVFWLHSVEGLREISWTLSRISERPDTIFQGFGRRVFTTIAPYCLMVSFPMRLLIEGFSWVILGQIAVVTMSYWIFLRWFWKRGLEAYSSASS